MAIPAPEAGPVVSYAYLWHDEHLAGLEEGRKDRPAVIALAARRHHGDVADVTVLPITHRPPSDHDWAIKIPLPVKRHLGLDHARSWIVDAEGNDLLWPGCDLRKIPGTDRYDYDFLPPRFFDRVGAGVRRISVPRQRTDCVPGIKQAAELVSSNYPFMVFPDLFRIAWRFGAPCVWVRIYYHQMALY